jgi:hypothetical protein
MEVLSVCMSRVQNFTVDIDEIWYYGLYIISGLFNDAIHSSDYIIAANDRLINEQIFRNDIQENSHSLISGNISECARRA